MQDEKKMKPGFRLFSQAGGWMHIPNYNAERERERISQLLNSLLSVWNGRTRMCPEY